MDAHPGSETRADKEQNAANVAAGKQRLRLASLIQFTLAGAPTVYYGDEVGLTGDDDPDDRRTYPWADRGGSPDAALLAHYRSLSSLRRSVPALVNGDFRVLLADDAAETIAYGRKTTSRAAIVAVNRSGETRTLDIPVAGYVPNGTTFTSVRRERVRDCRERRSPRERRAARGAVYATDEVDLDPPARRTASASRARATRRSRSRGTQPGERRATTCTGAR